MQIFILDTNPVQAAKYLCDKHVVNQPMESKIMLRGGWPHHRCTKWTWATIENYNWHLEHALALCDEYTYRYGKVIAHQEVLEYLKENPPDLRSLGLTEFAIACGDLDLNDPVLTYREYYRQTKLHFCKWTRRPEPWWIKQ